MLAEAERLCDAVCLIEGGRKILDGSLDEVRRPTRSTWCAWRTRTAASPRTDLPA